MAHDDKTEAPTPKKKREARLDGQLPRSQELVTWAALLIGSFAVGHTVTSANDVVREVLTRGERVMADPSAPAAMAVAGAGLRGALLSVLPLAGVMAAAGVVLNVAQIGWAPTTRSLKPKAAKLNPLKGLKKMVSPASLWEVVKSALKIVLLAGASWGPVSDAVTTLAAGGSRSLPQVVALTGGVAMGLVRRVAVAGLLLATVDYVLARRRVMKGMKMTKQEVRDESRSNDGNAEMKGEMRARAMRLSRNRMLSDVAKADVVVVNPTHVAVALKYSPGAGAPRVLAKGSGAVADRIRAEAKEHGVPMVADVPLARTIHKLCEVGAEVPADVYEAVAKILAFVFALRARGLAPTEVQRVPAFAGA